MLQIIIWKKNLRAHSFQISSMIFTSRNTLVKVLKNIFESRVNNHDHNINIQDNVTNSIVIWRRNTNLNNNKKRLQYHNTKLHNARSLGRDCQIDWIFVKIANFNYFATDCFYTLWKLTKIRIFLFLAVFRVFSATFHVTRISRGLLIVLPSIFSS